MRWSWAMAAALAPMVAAAQEEDPEALLRRGVALRTEGRDEEAVAVFAAAWRRARSPLAAGQLGLAEQATGRWLDAEAHLREALAATDDAWVTRNRAALEGAYAVNRQHVGALELQGNVEGATVRVDGAEVGALPLAAPLRLLLGTVTVEVSAPGHHPLTRRVSLAPGVTRERFELHPLPVPAPQPVTTPRPIERPSPPPPSDAPRVVVPAWTWALVGVAGAGLATGVTALALREDAAAEFNRGCPMAPPMGAHDARCQALLTRGETMQTLMGVGFGVGAAALVGAGAVVAWAVTHPERRPRALACAPTITVTGVACALRF